MRRVPSDEEDDENLPRDGDTLTTKRGRYTVERLLGKGGYGAVYEVRRGDGEKFAMKCESRTARKKVLPMECKVVRGADAIRSIHFCRLEDKGRIDEKFTFLVMKLVGKNLWDLRVQRASMRFTLNTSLKLAEQCLICLEELHRIGYIHRDVKPGNFAVGRSGHEEHTVFVLDFGLCRKYTFGEKDLRMPRLAAPFRGTTRYAPLAAHYNREQSRKDDIESLLYVVVEWTNGALPWKKEKGAEGRPEVLRQKKMCREDGVMLDRFLKRCPKREFMAIMYYLDSLDYTLIPDYAWIHYCLLHAAKVNHCAPTDALDWDPTNDYHGPSHLPGDGRPYNIPDPSLRSDRHNERGEARAAAGIT